ncbi:tetratricopeptide repeat protein [Labilibaculum sp.]|uniref:tetratricopeptide repeat-containing sensor histidine kinase n=1 Tax=Labilibaculum sp. TaxID=2060723 RepID=UPI0035660260
MRLLLPFLLIIINSLQVYSNQTAINENVDKVKNPQKEKIFEIIKCAEQLRDSSFDASIKTGKQAIKLALPSNKANIIAASCKSLGVTYFYQGVFDSAQYYYEKSILEFNKLSDSLNIGKVTSNIGIIYRRTGMYDKALQQYLKALEIYKSLGYKSGVGSAYFNIGGVYQTLNQTEKALVFYKSAQKIYEDLHNYARLTNIFINMGVLQVELNNYEESLTLLLHALELNKHAENMQLKSTILLNIGQSYVFLNQADKALEYYNECEKLRIQLNDYWGLSQIFTLKANVYNKLNNDNKAEEYFQKSIKTSKQNHYSDLLKEAYYYYSAFLEKRKKAVEAISYLKKYNHLKDSLITIYQNRTVAELTAKYESEQRKNELEVLTQKSQIQQLELSKKNYWIILLIVVLIVGVVAILISLRINRLRVDHKIMDLRQKVLLTQMNPHFLFNSLTAIQSFILDHKNKEANNYLSRLASLVRGILENSREEFVSLRTELETLQDYIGLQKLRFENEISYEFKIGENIDQDEVLVPPMLAQPFVENALIHGMLRNKPDAKIQVQVFLNGNKEMLNFQIRDNGIGIDEAKNLSTNKNHKSLATSIAIDRVKIYNFKSSKKMHFEIADLKNMNPMESGTQVTYSIPLLISN